MIKSLEDYLEEYLGEELTYGQIQDNIDNLINLNIYDTGKKPYFGDDKTHILKLNLYIRDNSFENMQSKNETVSNSLVNIYDVVVSHYHIINIKKTGSNEPQRDTKNRYSITSSYEIKLEEV